MRHMRPAIVAALAATAFAGPAAAGFRACTETGHPIALAVAHSTGKDWVSQGWWRIPPKTCTPIFNGTLEARFYYLRGVHLDVGGGWVGNRSFCVSRQSFKVSGRDKCEERGYEKAGFFEVDTQDAEDYTHTLTE
ncbi:MAG: DUF1036 domain-containing protein [Alphaproteobacteria bacterium]